MKTWHRGYQSINVHNVEDARGAALKWISYNVDVLKAYDGLTGDQVKVIAEEAHKRGLWVTGHANGPDNTIARINAGQDAIEHLGFATGGKVTPEVNIRPAAPSHHRGAHADHIVGAIGCGRVAGILDRQSAGQIDDTFGQTCVGPSIIQSVF